MDGPKAELRRVFKQRRRALHPSTAPRLQRQAMEQLPKLLPEGMALGLYWPLPGEVDLRSLAELPGLANRIALPCIAGGELRYRRWNPGDPTANDDTGIPAPTSAASTLAAERPALGPSPGFRSNGDPLGLWRRLVRPSPAAGSLEPGARPSGRCAGLPRGAAPRRPLGCALPRLAR